MRPENSILLKELIDSVTYIAETGVLIWKERPVTHFKNKASCKRWNTIYAGKRAFCTAYPNGYLRGRFDGVEVYAQRVVWAVLKDAWPTSQIDHINGVRTDNRIENLRSVSPAENAKNQKTRRNNTSGFQGVYWHESRGKWSAQIRLQTKLHFLGYFSKFDDACSKRKFAERQMGFHENHGRITS